MCQEVCEEGERGCMSVGTACPYCKIKDTYTPAAASASGVCYPTLLSNVFAGISLALKL